MSRMRLAQNASSHFSYDAVCVWATVADGIELSAKQVERLNHLTQASGERHDEGNMSVIDR